MKETKTLCNNPGVEWDQYKVYDPSLFAPPAFTEMYTGGKAFHNDLNVYDVDGVIIMAFYAKCIDKIDNKTKQSVSRCFTNQDSFESRLLINWKDREEAVEILNKEIKRHSEDVSSAAKAKKVAEATEATDAAEVAEAAEAVKVVEANEAAEAVEVAEAAKAAEATKAAEITKEAAKVAKAAEDSLFKDNIGQFLRMCAANATAEKADESAKAEIAKAKEDTRVKALEDKVAELSVLVKKLNKRLPRQTDSWADTDSETD